MKRAGNRLWAKGGVYGDLQENGDVKWSHGYTSRLFKPCPDPDSTCVATWDSFPETVRGRSWDSRDPSRKTIEKITFKDVDGRLCSFGTKSKKNCYI